MGHAEMMQSSDKQCKDCAKQIKNGQNDINGNVAMMPMAVMDLGINAPQNYMSTTDNYTGIH